VRTATFPGAAEALQPGESPAPHGSTRALPAAERAHATRNAPPRPPPLPPATSPAPPPPAVLEKFADVLEAYLGPASAFRPDLTHMLLCSILIALLMGRRD